MFTLLDFPHNMKCLGLLFFVPVNVTNSKVGTWFFPEAAATRNTIIIIIIIPLENISNKQMPDP